MPPLILGVDAGTTGIRAIVFDLKGGIVAQASAPTPTRSLGPGSAEHDAETLWRTACAVISAAVRGAGEHDARRIRSIAVGSMGEAGVLVDAEGRPLVPIMAWYDSRPAPQLARLEATFGRAALHARTGLCPDSSFTLLKLLWLREHQREAVEAASAWLSVSGWLAFRLSGRRGIDFSHASRVMALDITAAAWSADILAAAGIQRALLGEPQPAGTELGAVLPEVVRATGLPTGCTVGVGGHDHICGLLALGADAPGVVLDSLGTAEALTLVVPKAPPSPALLEAGINQGVVQVEQPLSYLFGGLPTSGAAVEWFRSLWGQPDYAELIAEAAAVPPSAHEVMFLPQLRIGSPPFPDPIARGGFVGISDACSRGVLFRALLEGIALDTASQLALMQRQTGVAVRRILATGGGTRNPLLMQIKADLFGMPVAISATTESTCLGAALLGGLAAGLYPDLATARAGLAGEHRHVAPNPAWPAAERARRLAAYAESYALLRGISARLRAPA